MAGTGSAVHCGECVVAARRAERKFPSLKCKVRSAEYGLWSGEYRAVEREMKCIARGGRGKWQMRSVRCGA